MKTVKEWFVKAAASVAALALIVAVASFGSDYFYAVYRSGVP